MKRWLKLLNTDCRVIRIQKKWIYPIYKNAFTSLDTVASEERLNGDIANCDNIIVFLRNQENRFPSGVGEYLDNSNNVNQQKTEHGVPSIMPKQVIDKIISGEIQDRHFCPQAVWLFHLYRHYQGNLSVKAMSDAKDYTHLRMKEGKYKNFKLSAPEHYLADDRKLMKFIGQDVNIKTVMEELGYVLS